MRTHQISSLDLASFLVLIEVGYRCCRLIKANICTHSVLQKMSKICQNLDASRHWIVGRYIQILINFWYFWWDEESMYLWAGLRWYSTEFCKKKKDYTILLFLFLWHSSRFVENKAKRCCNRHWHGRVTERKSESGRESTRLNQCSTTTYHRERGRARLFQLAQRWGWVGTGWVPSSSSMMVAPCHCRCRRSG
jgi:hypothetical protein